MQNSYDLNWDSKLNISTESVDYSEEDLQNYGYDPTPYVVLERLASLKILKKEDVVVDYGCGKGRIGFFINSQVGCRVIGIDHSEKLLEEADNVPDGANRFYFFNPFSTRIFSEVLKRIEESFKRNPRDILIFFYYSTIEYKLYLPTQPRLELIESLYFSEEEINNSASAKLDIFRFHPLNE